MSNDKMLEQMRGPGFYKPDLITEDRYKAYRDQPRKRIGVGNLKSAPITTL
jgi:hypothetical protein